MSTHLSGVAVLLALTGCDLVFGLGDPGAPDAPPGSMEVRVELIRRGIRNDASGAPVLESAPFRLPVEVITFADGTSPPVTSDPAGFLTFTRRTADEAYRVELSDEAGGIEIQTTAADLRFSVPEYGRLERVEATPDTVIEIAIASAMSDGALRLMSTGVWTQTDVDPGSKLDWSTTSAFTSPPGLLQASAGDHAYAVEAAQLGDPAAPYRAISAMCELAPALEMTSGGSHAAGCTLTPVPPSACIRVEAPLASEDARLLGALAAPDLYPQAGSLWAILAAPAPSLSPRAGLELAVATASPARDWSADIHHPRPFPGHAIRLTSASSRIRSVTRNGAQPIGIAAITYETETPAADCTTPSRIGGTTAIPGGFVLDGSALGEDASISLSGAPRVTLRWSHAAAGAADYHVVFLDEVTTVTSGGVLTTAVVPRRLYVTTTLSADIDSGLLEADRAYMIGVLAVRGLPGAASGDLDNRDPGSEGGALTYSGVFTVQP